MSTWTAVTITTAAELAESLASFLVDLGAPGLQTEEVGEHVRIIAHFASAAPLAELDAFLAALGELFPAAPRPQIAVETVADDGWAENWKAHFPPLAIGERLFVHPPWVDGIPADRIGIVLDPGMAFGTGHHASTRGCLVLLERALRAGSARRACSISAPARASSPSPRRSSAPATCGASTSIRDACAVAIENAARQPRRPTRFASPPTLAAVAGHVRHRRRQPAGQRC